jgi:hypothetical protein
MSTKVNGPRLAGGAAGQTRPQNSWVSGSFLVLLKARLLIRKPRCVNNVQGTLNMLRPRPWTFGEPTRISG